MATKKQKGDGPYSAPARLYPGKGDQPEAKGEDLSRVIYGENDKPAVRGGRPDRDKTGR